MADADVSVWPSPWQAPGEGADIVNVTFQRSSLCVFRHFLLFLRSKDIQAIKADWLSWWWYHGCFFIALCNLQSKRSAVCLNLRWILHSHLLCAWARTCASILLPKHTSFIRAEADKACRAWVWYGALWNTGQTNWTLGQMCLGTVWMA